MSISTDMVEDSLRINLHNNFQFAQHTEFRESYENVKQVRRYILDFSKVTHVDSSSLGMLLLLKEHAGGEKARITFVNCNKNIRKILRIANFQQEFDIA